MNHRIWLWRIICAIKGRDKATRPQPCLLQFGRPVCLFCVSCPVAGRAVTLAAREVKKRQQKDGY
jgi:hypothetical protein